MTAVLTRRDARPTRVNTWNRKARSEFAAGFLTLAGFGGLVYGFGCSVGVFQ